jgi:hypothetical protein
MLAGAAHLKPLYTPSDSMATNIRPCLSAVAVLQDLLHLSGRQQLAGELVARGAVGLAAAAARTSGQQTWCVAGSCGPSSADDACKLIPATTAVWGGDWQLSASGSTTAAAAAACAPEACLLGLLRCLVLDAADQLLALLSELTVRQARQTRRMALRAVLSTCAGFSEPSLRSCCSLQLIKPATCGTAPG